YWNGSNTRWAEWHPNAKDNDDYVKVTYPKTMYVDVSETLEKAGYYFTVNWHYGGNNETGYRIILNGFAFGKPASGYPAGYYGITNAFSDYSYDADMISGGKDGTGNSSTDIDLKLNDSWDGATAVIWRNHYDQNVNKLYPKGTPPKTTGTYSYSTSGNNPTSFGGFQKWKGWPTNKWKESYKFYKNTTMTVSDYMNDYYQDQGWKEVFFDIVVYDKSALNTAINEAKTFKNANEKYAACQVNGTFDALVTAITNAEAKLKTREITQTEINNAATAVTNAKNAVQFNHDTTETSTVAYDGGNTHTHTTTNKQFCKCGYINETETINAACDDITSVTANPTCTAVGTTSHRCGVCNNTYTTEIPATGHSWGAWQTVTEATCEGAGTQKRVCTKDSSHVETQPIAAAGHTWVAQPGKDATCTEAGYTAFEKCSKCQAEQGKTTINAQGHSFTSGTYKNDGDGNHSQKCIRCDVYGDAAAHTYGTVSTVTAPSCDAVGSGTKTCTACGDVATVEIPATGEHSYTGAYKDNADGTHSQKCLTCANYGATVNHNYNQEVATDEYFATNATCTAAATYYKSCVCGAKGTETFASGSTIPHKYSKVEAKAATCSATGNEEYWTCSTCTNIFSDTDGTVTTLDAVTIGINADNHKFVNYTSNNDATCLADGTKKGACEWCGKPDIITDVGSQKDHSYTGAFVQENNQHAQLCVNGCGGHNDFVPCTGGTATCQTKATCETCNKPYGETVGHVYKRNITKIEGNAELHSVQCQWCDATTTVSHNYGTEPSSTTNATCLTDTIKYYTCSTCNYEKSVIVENSALGHDLIDDEAVAATCTTEGKTAGSHCSVCKTVIAEQTVIPAKGHAYGAWETVTAATCEGKGSEKRVCANDASHVEEREISALGHKYSTEKSEENLTRPVKNADGTWTDGYYTLTCENDSTHTTTEDVARADYTGFEAAKADVEAMPTQYNLTDAGKEKVEAALAEAETLAQDRITTEQDAVDEAEAELRAVVAEIIANEDGKYIIVGADCENGRHTYDDAKWIVIDEPSCTEKGKESNVCLVCGISYTREISALKHNWGKWSNVDGKAATCVAAGERIRTCERCGKTETEIVAATGEHVWVDYIGKDATCTVSGFTSGRQCDTCGLWLVEQKEIPATGHRDLNGDGRCDTCQAELEVNSGNCDCMCHKTSWIMKLICKIVKVFWKLFRINKTCACGGIHY
ncbi:MAG: FIVAR domain-containing protein, partial [Ruminococcus sp.]|nr:FIVAR domain-containing protein [Ruminococcus sp.]